MVPSDLNPAAEAGDSKEKALKNDEVFGCARSVYFGDFENYHSEYHPLNHDSVVLVGPLPPEIPSASRARDFFCCAELWGWWLRLLA